MTDFIGDKSEEMVTHSDVGVLNTRFGVAAYAWWLSLRPPGWGQEQHIADPTVNCAFDADKALARAVATEVARDAEDDE